MDFAKDDTDSDTDADHRSKPDRPAALSKKPGPGSKTRRHTGRGQPNFTDRMETDPKVTRSQKKDTASPVSCIPST
jgi:hypothetical protein